MLKSNLLSFLLISSLLLNGCGGGGNSSSTKTETENSNNTTQNSTILKVYAGVDRTAQVNTTIVISGTVNNSSNIHSYEWKKGNQVLATTLKFSYIPTEVGTDTLVLTVTTNNGDKISDSMSVEVIEKYDDEPLPF